VVLPKGWIVERTLAWLSANRLLSKEYERLSWHTESWIMLVSIFLLLKAQLRSILFL
jgi:transposase